MRTHNEVLWRHKANPRGCRWVDKHAHAWLQRFTTVALSVVALNAMCSALEAVRR